MRLPVGSIGMVSVAFHVGMRVRMIIPADREAVRITRVHITVHLHKEEKSARGDQAAVGEFADYGEVFAALPGTQDSPHNGQGRNLSDFNTPVEEQNVHQPIAAFIDGQLLQSSR